MNIGYAGVIVYKHGFMHTMHLCKREGLCIDVIYEYMQVCMDVRIYASMHAYTQLCMIYRQVCMHAYMQACMHAYMYVCICVCMHACVYACMHVCMHACMRVCKHACMYVSMHA